MTFADTQDRPGIQESYLSAGSSTNLAMDDSNRRQPGDILAASAMGGAHTGGMFARLRSEFDGVEHPRPMDAHRLALAAQKLGKEEIESAEYKAGRKLGTTHVQRQLGAAKFIAHQWLLHETALMLQKLKTWPAARRATLRIYGDEALPALMWWLDPACTQVDCKEGFLLVPNTNRLGARRCPRCEMGKIPMPGDQKLGKEVTAWITSSMARWVTATRQANSRMEHHQP